MNDVPSRHLRVRIGLISFAIIAASGAAYLFVAQILPRFWPAQPELRGEAVVVDAISLKVGAREMRIKGVDAPINGQTCTQNGETWNCGDEAAAFLITLVKNRPVVCVRNGTGRSGRPLGHCKAGEVDLGERLVREGWAVSFDSSYLREEAEARRHKRGLWQGEFERPRDWRRKQRRS